MTNTAVEKLIRLVEQASGAKSVCASTSSSGYVVLLPRTEANRVRVRITNLCKKALANPEQPNFFVPGFRYW